MTYIKWFFILGFWGIMAATFHYTLPQRDVVYVQGTEIIRQDFSGINRLFYAQADTGNDGTTINRDLRLINTTDANGRIMVYRNEDTGFGWPPYFKLDSSNLQAEAQGATTVRAKPEWYIIKHYGWRNEFLTIYPNAISLKPVDGPDANIGLPVAEHRDPDPVRSGPSTQSGYAGAGFASPTLIPQSRNSKTIGKPPEMQLTPKEDAFAAGWEHGKQNRPAPSPRSSRKINLGGGLWPGGRAP